MRAGNTKHAGGGGQITSGTFHRELNKIVLYVVQRHSTVDGLFKQVFHQWCGIGLGVGMRMGLRLGRILRLDVLRLTGMT